MQPHDRASLICFSHLRWDFVFQRPQHLMVRAARSRWSLLGGAWALLTQKSLPSLEFQKREGGVIVVSPLLPWSSIRPGRPSSSVSCSTN